MHGCGQGRNSRVIHWDGGGVYSYIRVLPDEFLLKSVFTGVDFNRSSLGRTQIYEFNIKELDCQFVGTRIPY